MAKWLIKSDETSLPDRGKYPGARTDKELLRTGIIILDKPSGPTSHQVDAWIKQITGVSKASHGGTLDPRVSGVLLIALEEATKLMPILLSSRKEYVALINLHKDAPEADVHKALERFIGKIKQLPPKKSAVARRMREREIYYLEVLEISGRNVLIKVGCEAGTYIRRLADDLGKKLGIGAHLQELRRTRSGAFSEACAVTMQAVCDALETGRMRDVVMPMERVADGMKAVVIRDSAVDAVCNGAPLATGGLARIEKGIERGDWTAVLTHKGELVSIGKAQMNSSDMMRRKGVAVRTERVIMKKGTYPKSWAKADK
ncbi:MAG: RNA-guided pseudouridylation complex pseudouridine synthase subunit Cbf5 [Candidatus Aenigmatarchaeota archaeon]